MTFTITQQPNSANLYLYPNGSSATDLTAFGETENYECVDDIWHTSNDDTDYVYSSASSTVSDWYTLEDHTTETGTINYVQITSKVRSVDAALSSSATYKLIIDDTSSTSLSDSFTDINTTYSIKSNVWTTKPSGGAWTWTDIDNLKAGILHSSASSEGDNISSSFLPTANGDLNQFTRTLGTGAHWELVDDPIDSPDTNTRIWPNHDDDNEYELFQVANHDPAIHAGTISKIRVYFRLTHDTGDTAQLAGTVRVGSTTDTGTYYSGGVYPAWETKYEEWVTNPDTSSAWTWSDIDSLQIGVRTGNVGVNDTCAFTQVYLIVYHTKIFPEIRTTQCYAVVNYDPPASTVTLNTPMTLSASHSRKIGRVTFPDGSYEVDDYGRAGKSLKITGHETSSAAANMQKLKDMCHYGEKVTIAGLPDSNHNTDYMIRNFSYKQAGGMVDRYIWSLDLEED